MTSKLSRRELLAQSTVLLLLVPIAAIGCSSSPADNGAASCNGAFSTSSSTNGHTHTLCVPTTDLTSPPSGGQTYTSSNSAGHTHTVTLTQQDLMTVSGGGTATILSSSPSPHTFAIKKA